MQVARWAIGAALLGGCLVLIIAGALPFSFFPGTPFEGFAGRALYVLALAAALCMWRVLRGPTPADRAVAIDILGVLIVGFCAVAAMATRQGWYIDIGIAWALQSFIGSLALAKYLEGRSLDA